MSAGARGRGRAWACSALAAAAVALLVAASGSARAHDPGLAAGDAAARIVQVAPIDGVTWGVHGGDERLWVVNRSGRDLVVIGYFDEPWLRIGPAGVFVNHAAPSAGAARPTSSDGAPFEPTEEVDWRRIGDGVAHAWHDDRIVAPLAGEAPSRAWTVPFAVGGGTLPLFGEAVRVTGPPVWPWLLAAALLSGTALAGWRTRPRDDGGRPDLARPAALVLVVVAGLQVVHVVDGLIALAPGASPALGPVAATAGVVVAGVAAGRRGRRGDATGFGLLAAGSAVVFVGVRVLVAGALDASQLASVLPDAATRLAVAAGLVQVLGVGGVAVAGARRVDRARSVGTRAA